MKSALYDNNSFFDNYLELRSDSDNYNDLFEQPEMFSLLPNLQDLKILDLGCGYGASAIKFMDLGAKSVLGVDVSKNMIKLAKEKNCKNGISYLVMDAEEIKNLDDRFDVVYSSLMIHYIEKLSDLFKNIHGLLNTSGELLFSMEHPIVTSTQNECKCHFDQDGDPDYYYLSDYALESRREVIWLDTPIVKYHRKVSTVLNMLIDAGFDILKVEEPIPNKELRAQIPRMRQEIHRPSYLMCKCKKR